MPEASYWRRWRADHPEYRARQAILRRQRRAINGRECRAAEYARRASRALPRVEPYVGHSGHELYDQARQVVGPRRGSLTTLYDPLYDDLVAEAVLAILEGLDPAEAVRVYGARERAWGRITTALAEGPIARKFVDN